MFCNRRAKMFFVKQLAAGSALRHQKEKVVGKKNAEPKGSAF